MIEWNYVRECVLNKENKYNVGQGLPEYALLLVLVAIVILLALTNMGQTIGETFSNIMAMF